MVSKDLAHELEEIDEAIWTFSLAMCSKMARKAVEGKRGWSTRKFVESKAWVDTVDDHLSRANTLDDFVDLGALMMMRWYAHKKAGKKSGKVK